MMKKIRRWPAFTIITVLMGPILFLTGCKEETSNGAAKAYYVISEELDGKRTTDKAQEILENAGAYTQTVSGNDASKENEK